MNDRKIYKLKKAKRDGRRPNRKRLNKEKFRQSQNKRKK